MTWCQRTVVHTCRAAATLKPAGDTPKPLKGDSSLPACPICAAAAKAQVADPAAGAAGGVLGSPQGRVLQREAVQAKGGAGSGVGAADAAPTLWTCL